MNSLRILDQVVHLTNFTNENIIDYGMIMNDNQLIEPMAYYIKQIIHKFKEETAETKSRLPTFTRCGRLVKKPIKLDL